MLNSANLARTDDALAADSIPTEPSPADSLSTDARNGKRKKKRSVSQTYWAEEQDEIESDVPREARLKLIAEYGDFSIAYSTAVQPCLRYFGDEQGYIAHRSRWGITFALGDVVAPPERRAELIDGFLAQHKRVMFCQIGSETAAVLHERGFCINEMGVDTTLTLPDYHFNGKQKEWLRYAANWSRRRDYEIVEAGFDQVTPDQVEEVSEAWRKTRTVKRKEVRFLNRPIVLQDERDVRRFFYLAPDGQLLAFVFLDPLYRNGQKIGYVTSFKRRHPDAPIYAEQAIMKQVIDTLKQENVDLLKLGLSPLAWIEDDQFQRCWMTHRLFQHAFRARWVNRYFYHLVGHADYKRRFRGEEEKVYLATQRSFRPLRLMALVGLCGVA